MLDKGYSPVPGELAELTAQWLTGTLRESGDLPLGTVSSVAVETIGADRGFTGVLARLSPRYQGASGTPPGSLVAKLPTATPATPSTYRLRQQSDLERARLHYERCAREVTCYRELGIAGDPAPRLYHAATDPDRLSVALLLEDLAGATPGDQLAGATPAQAYAVLAAIAPLHARMWQRPPPDWLPPFITDPGAAQQRYAGWVGPFLARYGDRLPPAVCDLVQELRETYAEVLTELDQAPATVIHAELHLDNIMFGGPGDGRPAVLLDWQSARRGPAAVDVVEVVVGGLAPADRRAAEEHLLGRYVALLAEYGVTDYPLTRLRHDCRLALLRQVAGAVGWLANADPDRLTGREAALVAAVFGDGRLVSALGEYRLA